MKATKYLLIGGGLASNEAAKQLRVLDPEGRATLVGEESHAPYDRPPLSKEFLRGEKAKADLFDPEESLREQAIDHGVPSGPRRPEEVMRKNTGGNHAMIRGEMGRTGGAL